MTFERPNIEVMKGYMPGEQPRGNNIVKLNTNENPYPPGPKVAHCLSQIGVDSLRRYPPPLANDFRLAAAQLHQVTPENIIPTNGGDEFLRLVMTTFVGAGETIAVTKPSYSLYPVLAEIQDSKLVEIALEDDWSMPKNFAKRLNQLNAKLAIIVNPHAPTGSLLDCHYLAEVAHEFKGILLVDEAYVDFIEPELGYDSIVLINQFPNILFLRSMSKGYSLAGLRFGYGIGPEQLINPMMYKTRDSYNTDFIAQKLATAAILDKAYAQDTWDKVRASRKILAISLSQLGLPSPPSQANFLLCDIPETPGALALYKSLKAENILVRYFDQDRLRNKLRISIGNDAENQRLVSAIEQVL
ncbi:MAG: histidinol-phosphate aminotransferase [Pseudohongiellaceae bacterium]|jgi:histidinol-phosphate aminotransferase